MATMIRRLAYVSRPRPGLPLVEIPRIVARCRVRNELDGITGVLLFTGLEFAHLIEGSPNNVTDVWARIRADDRHCDIVALLDEQSPSRHFADWRMGFPSANGLATQIAVWREHKGPWNAIEHDDMLRLFMSADAL
jgi:hypothetical protein